MAVLSHLFDVGTLVETPFFSVYKNVSGLPLLKYQSVCSVEFSEQDESVPVVQVNLQFG